MAARLLAPAMRLTDLSYRTGKLEYRSRHATEPEWVLEGYLEEAGQIVRQAEAELAAPERARRSADFETLRWFPLPEEVAAELRGEGSEGAGEVSLQLR